MLRILLLGKNGQLGWELNRTLLPLGDVIALDFPEIDLSKTETIFQTIADIHPQVIVNATAYTAVDRAESETELAQAINAFAPAELAQAARSIGAALIHYSTDYVFDGTKGSAYFETDQPNPLNYYGQSKLDGEQAIIQIDPAFLILRTSWVYSLRRDSFVIKVLQWSRKQKILRIVADQIGNPTWARALAEISAQLLASAHQDIPGWINEHKGIYHLAGDGHASRYQWAGAILRYNPNRSEQVTQEIQPALTSEFFTPAKRPLYSALNCEQFFETFRFQLPNWELALQLALDQGH